MADLGVRDRTLPQPAGTAERNAQVIEAGLGKLSFMALLDVVVFFAVLLVGFAYVWKQGDLNWVRALDQREVAAVPESADAIAQVG